MNSRICLTLLVIFISMHLLIGQDINFFRYPQPFLPDSVISESDTAYYMFRIGVVASGCEITGWEVRKEADSIFVRTCIYYGNFGAPCGSGDTALIGQLDPGIYHLVHASFAKPYPVNNDSLCYDDPDSSTQWDTARYVLTVLSTTSTEELAKASSSLQTWPNPVADQLTISGWKQREGWLKLYDSQGRLVHNQWIEKGTQTIDVSVWDMPSGVYLVRFEDRGGGARSRRVVVY